MKTAPGVKMSKLPKVFCNTNKLVYISKLEVDVSLLMNLVCHNEDDITTWFIAPLGLQGKPPSHQPSCNLKLNIFMPLQTLSLRRKKKLVSVCELGKFMVF